MTTLSPTFSPTRSNGSDETTTENSTAAAAAATETGICTTTSTTTTCDGQFDNDDDDLESGRNRKYRPHQELLVIKTPIGVTLRGKYQLRAAVQMVVFGGLVIGYAVYNSSSLSLSLSLSLSSLLTSLSGNDDQQIRFLEEQQGDTVEPAILCDDFDSPWWLTLLYIIGILYMFLALAIICDEFFVPALEELSGPRRMNLSMDVAGATLMAAGGSAPELATSLIGTFRQSEIGFGTIVGSAVFNILFVIGMCSLLAKEVLNLTWWPLFRDISYYTIGLVVLAVFVGAVGIGEISLWEACILFAMYFGYILLMWQNKNLYKAITGNDLVYPEEEEENDDISNGNSNNDDGDGDGDGDDDDDDDDNDNDNDNDNDEEEKPTEDTSTSESKAGMRAGLKKENSKSSIHSQVSQLSAKHSEHSNSNHPHFRWQGTFRAGILKLLKDGDSWMDTAGTGIVSKIIGDADYVFEQVDKDGNGHIDKDELRQLFDLLECHAPADELDEVFVQLDTNGDGVISRKEFTEWYCRAEEQIMSQVRHVFDQIDVDKSNTLDKEELKTLLATLDPHVSDEDVQSALEEMYKHGSPDEITFDEFSEWYKSSMIYERQKQLIEDDIDGVFDDLRPPKDGGVRDWVWYIICLPLVFVLTFTIPDVQRPGMGKWCYVSFIISIIWIGGFSYFMVDWAEIVGKTFGIPSEIMGLTVLAAGTSVPDLLSSVIVARRGQGDMAVSSSVGSNIFDILVGLPLPWILYSAVNKGEKINVASEGLIRSLLILIVMLVLVVISIHCQGWKLTKTLGGFMFLFYILFLVQAILLALPFEVICVE